MFAYTPVSVHAPRRAHTDTTHLYVGAQSKANENKSPSYTGSCPAIKLALTGTDSHTASECFYSAMRSVKPKEKSLGSSSCLIDSSISCASYSREPALAVGGTGQSPEVLYSPYDPVIIRALILTDHS